MGNNTGDLRAPESADVDLHVRPDLGRSSTDHEVQHNVARAGGAPRKPYDAGGGGQADIVSKQDAAKANAQGVEFLSRNQHDEAVNQFKEALRCEPNSVQILNNIGLAYAKMQDYGSAYEWYERAYKQDTSDVETLFSLAWVERKRQRYSHARDLFKKVLDLHPEHVKALYLLGDILKSANDYDGAIRHFERLVRLDPHSIDGHIALAQCCEHSKEYLRAAQLFSIVLQLAPGRADVTFFLGRVYYLAKQYKQALTHLERVLDSDSRAFEARTYCAKACRELEDHQRAIAHAERAAQFRPHPDVQHFMGEEYARFGDQQKAAQCFTRALDLEPNHVPSLVGLGELKCPVQLPAVASRNHGFGVPSDRSAPTYAGPSGPAGPSDRQAAAEPEDLERLLRRAERASAAARQGNGGTDADQLWQEVLASAKVALRTKPRDALALRCAARALLSTGGAASDIREYARRAAENGDEGFTLGYELHVYLAAAHERERDLSAAEKHFMAALSSKSGDESAMLGLARVLSLRGEMAKARQLHEQILASNPSCVESLTKLSEMALEAEEYASAYQYASKAAKLGKPDATTLCCLGYACAKTDRNDEAVKALEEALMLQPTDSSAIKTLAHLCRKTGRDQDAINWFQRLLDIRPGDYDCSLNLAQLYAARGNAGASQSVHYLRSALQCRPSSREAREIYVQMAKVQKSVRLWKDAQQTLEGAVREIPDDAELWHLLLEVYEQMQDTTGQQQCHGKLVQLNGMTSGSKVSYGELLMTEGKLRDAREQFEQVLKHEPNNVQALLKLATSWRQDPSREGHLEEARRGFERVLQLSLANAEALEGAAYCHRKANNQDQAIQLYQQCLKVKSTAEGPLYYLGDILYRQHRHAECQHYLARLVETNCSADYKTGALYLLAKSHVSLDEYEEAEKHARAGLALKPNHPHFLFIFALVKNRMAEYDKSISTLKQALSTSELGEIDQLRVEIHDWMAQAYERKHEYALAMSELDQALQRDPSHVSSLITRGLVHIQLKQLDQAETAFRRALAVEKNHALALVRLGYCKLLSNDHHEAMQHFQRALQQRCGTVALPRSVKGSARVYMALSLMGQQDVKGALTQLVEARKSHRNFANICSKGKDVIVKGECEGLVNQLRDASDLDMNVAQAWQLVHLLAKELELDLRDGDTAKEAAPAAKPAVAPTSGYPPASLAKPLPRPGAPLLEPPPPAVSAARGHSPGGPAGSPQSSPPPAARRRWETPASPEPAPERRAWATPPPAQAPPPSAPAVASSGPRQLKLHLHEQIDYSELTQNECLGTGGFGAVYRGLFKGKEVAIKKLFCEDGGNISPLQLEELEKEIAALRGLDHPRLVAFIGACLQRPNLCIVTEFMPGGSLHHLLHKAKTPLTLGQQAKMAMQICEGVSFLHSLVPPVVHRDLKSLNIVLDYVYNAKICDFGLTQSMDKTHISLKEGGNGGSPRYMAPECYDCKGKITEKVDVWAMGCILVEVFGGPLPYDDCNNIQQIVAKVLIDKQLPYIPHHLPRGLRPIIEDCFHFDIKQRASAQDVYSRLLQLRLSPGAD